MNLEKYSKLPIDTVVTELYRQGPNPDFNFPPTAAKLLDMLSLGLTPQSLQSTLGAPRTTTPMYPPTAPPGSATVRQGTPRSSLRLPAICWTTPPLPKSI